MKLISKLPSDTSFNKGVNTGAERQLEACEKEVERDYASKQSIRDKKPNLIEELDYWHPLSDNEPIADNIIKLLIGAK